MVQRQRRSDHRDECGCIEWLRYWRLTIVVDVDRRQWRVDSRRPGTVGLNRIGFWRPTWPAWTRHVYGQAANEAAGELEWCYHVVECRWSDVQWRSGLPATVASGQSGGSYSSPGVMTQTPGPMSCLFVRSFLFISMSTLRTDRALVWLVQQSNCAGGRNAAGPLRPLPDILLMARAYHVGTDLCFRLVYTYFLYHFLLCVF